MEKLRGESYCHRPSEPTLGNEHVKRRYASMRARWRTLIGWKLPRVTQAIGEKYWCQVTGLCKNWEFLLSDKADKAERFRYHPVKRRTRYFSRNCKMTFSLVVVVVTSKFRE